MESKGQSRRQSSGTTIYDIAKKAGVSIATVSRVLNGSPKVSAASKEKVQSAIDEFSYIPSVLARGLSGQGTGLVGILVPVISDVNHAKIVAELERLLFERGYNALIMCSNMSERKRNQALLLMESKKVEGIMAVGAFISDLDGSAVLAEVSGRIPVVVVNGFVNEKSLSCVYSDSYGVMHELTCELIDKGYKTIVYLNDSVSYTGTMKLKGFQEAIAGNSQVLGIEIVIKQGDGIIEEAAQAVEKLILQEQKFSAVMAADDSMAVGALKTLNRHGMTCPVIGFNNSRYTKCTTPELSSIDNRVDQVCLRGVEMLVDMIAGGPAGGNEVIKSEFVQRDTYIR